MYHVVQACVQNLAQSARVSARVYIEFVLVTDREVWSAVFSFH